MVNNLLGTIDELNSKLDDDTFILLSKSDGIYGIYVHIQNCDTEKEHLELLFKVDVINEVTYKHLEQELLKWYNERNGW